MICHCILAGTPACKTCSNRSIDEWNDSTEQIDNAIRCAVSEKFTYYIENAIRDEAKSIARQYCEKKIEEVLADIFGFHHQNRDEWIVTLSREDFMD